MLTSPVWRLLLSQRLRVERETPKRSWTSFLGMPRSTAESTFNLRSFEYAFMDTIFMQVHYLRKPLLEQNPAYGTARPLGIGDAVQSAMYDPAKPPLKRRDGPQKEFLRPSAAIYARSC